MKKITLPAFEQALRGRGTPLFTVDTHFVNRRSLLPPFPEEMEQVLLGMGCFWGAEKTFWSIDGVYVTAVGYAGGYTPHPTYEEVCSGLTAHSEVVLVVYDPRRVSFATLLKTFWEHHDPTQGMRQGNDRGTQYRSAIYVVSDEQLRVAEQSKATYQEALTRAGLGTITTEICMNVTFYYAEPYHQQYLAKNPHGYCGLGGTGVTCGL